MLELWGFLSISSPSFTLDSHTKPFIWKQLLCIMKESPSSFSLHRLPNPRPLALLSVEEYTSSSPLSLISCNGVRGSCATFEEREDVTAIVLEEQPELQQVEDRCVHCRGWGGTRGVGRHKGWGTSDTGVGCDSRQSLYKQTALAQPLHYEG